MNSRWILGIFIGVISSTSWAFNQKSAESILCKLDLPSCEVAVFDPIDDGAGSAEKFYIETKDHQKFVFRLFHPQRSEDDRQRETLVNQLTSDAKVSPKLYWSDPKQGMLMAYIDHQQFDARNFQRISTAVNAGQLLAKLHQIQGFPETITKFDLVDAQINTIKKHLDPLPEKITKHIKAIEDIEATYRPHLQLTAVHNDPHPSNMLYDEKRFWLIDWEEGGQGDPMFDLATFSEGFVLGEGLREVLLDHYFPINYPEIETQKFEVMRCFTKGYYGLALLAKVLQNKNMQPDEIDTYFNQEDTPPLHIFLQDEIDIDDENQKDLTQSLVLVNDFARHLQQPAFKNALAALKKTNQTAQPKEEAEASDANPTNGSSDSGAENKDNAVPSTPTDEPPGNS